LSNGFGGPYDWLSLAVVGASERSYLEWTYLPAGATTYSWTVTMPTTAGMYEFRLLPNGAYTIAATSATVTVK
jgi:hypothetical protein